MKFKDYFIPIWKYWILVAILFFILLFIIPPTSALTITNTTGETSIQWNWDDASTATVYIDGIKVHENWIFQYAIKTDLQSNELHRIDITIGEDTFSQETYTDKTFWQTNYAYFLMGALVFLGLSIGIHLLAFGGWIFSFLLLIETVFNYQSHENFIWYLSLGLVLFIVSGFRSWGKMEG
jgi:hypothetical protein